MKPKSEKTKSTKPNTFKPKLEGFFNSKFDEILVCCS